MPAKQTHSRSPHANHNHPAGVAGRHVGQVDHTPVLHRGQGSRRPRGRNFFGGNPHPPNTGGAVVLPPPGGAGTFEDYVPERSSWR